MRLRDLEWLGSTHNGRDVHVVLAEEARILDIPPDLHRLAGQLWNAGQVTVIGGTAEANDYVAQVIEQARTEHAHSERLLARRMAQLVNDPWPDDPA